MWEEQTVYLIECWCPGFPKRIFSFLKSNALIVLAALYGFELVF